MKGCFSTKKEGRSFALFLDHFHTNYMVQSPDKHIDRQTDRRTESSLFFMNEDVVLVLKTDALNRKIIKGSDAYTVRDSPG
jgi:hypothetical protein